jgi:hypothetical protein
MLLKGRVFARLRHAYEAVRSKKLYVTAMLAKFNLTNYVVTTVSFKEYEVEKSGCRTVFREKLGDQFLVATDPPTGMFVSQSRKSNAAEEGTEPDAVGCLIDDTPRNRAAVEAIQAGLMSFGMALRTMLQPVNIDRTINQLHSSQGMLFRLAPVPEEKQQIPSEVFALDAGNAEPKKPKSNGKVA